MDSHPARPKKTDIVRKRTGCQNCKDKRRKCDETRPECLACVRRGIRCSGYNRQVTFRDVTSQAAESSKRFEEARWAELRLEDERRKRRRTEPPSDDSSPPNHPSDDPTETPAHTETLARNPPAPAPLPPWHALSNDGWLASPFTLPWALLDTSGAGVPFQGIRPDSTAAATEAGSPAPTISLAIPSSAQLTESGNPGSQEIASLVMQPHSPALSTTPWDEFLVNEGSPDSSSSGSSILGEPDSDCRISLSLEEALIQHFDKNVAPSIPVNIAFPDLFRQSNFFRAAVLALAASSLQFARPLSLDRNSLCRVYSDKSIWTFYDTAVKGLQAQLQNAKRHNSEELAGAALLLAYHELDVGTALGILNHASGLDAIASKLDFAASSLPELFKAWRMLRYDVRFMRTPTRPSRYVADGYDVPCFLDPQLAIRDILSRVHGLHSRYAMEASFWHEISPGGPSASEKAAAWLCSVLGRVCDHRNFQRRDFYKDTLTPQAILEQCEIMSRRLDTWHKGLCEHDLPIASLGTEQDMISGQSFETVITYRFSDDRKALDYVMYLVSRMTCNYLRSVFDPSASASATEAWAKVVLGIVCGMDMQRRIQFTVLRIDLLLTIAATLCESTNFATTVLDYLIPKVTASGIAGVDGLSWLWLKSAMELLLKEKRKGRAVRFFMDSMEEDSQPWQWISKHQIAVFGDYNGKGYFRDSYSVDYMPSD
ncbi:hypothetical protein CCHL11_02509 [Colletotrichum chlorophyti]|uniref:Zn(2)-C6 fungal-type domain-containing protein n=1 Tax=Colletotrichum chlorophyti TaxID=708187 RepID=A0A1Q8S986_9PEZI|nr:hypothetical protein CCHL11_02509 [Colletotrichum chlorophyti]